MIIAKHKWSSASNIENFDQFIELFKTNRKISDWQQFLRPQLEQLHDPLLMRDMQKAVEIIQQSIETDQLIYIYGDYDVDGVTSTSIIYAALELLGAKVKYLIPNRFSDGYGINSPQLKKILDIGAGLVITVDNGISAKDVFQEFENQAKFIVVDHHQLPDQLPDVDAIVHPKIGDYPFADLSAAAVALKLVQVLFEDLPIEFLDLAALGLVADVMPLIDENRAIVAQGLQVINQRENIGLNQLLTQLQIQQVTSQTIGFKIAPNLNALGRISDANPIVELLTSDDQNQIEKIADVVLQANVTRQNSVKSIVNKLLIKAKNSSDNFLLFYDQEYSEGILGIVAAQIVEETGKPAIIFNLTDNHLKGSARAPQGVNLFEVLNKQKHLLTNFGGHAGAAGLSLDFANFEKLSNQLQTVDLSKVENQELLIDGRLTTDQINLDFYQKIQALQPFGNQNQEPQFLIESNLVNLKMMGDQNQHAKLTLENNLEAICFNRPQLSHLKIGQPLQLIGRLDINDFNNKQTIQIVVVDITDQLTVIDRNFFARIYQTIKKQPIRVNQVDQQVLDVFLELGFVKIINGQVIAVESVEKQVLTKSLTYQKRFA